MSHSDVRQNEAARRVVEQHDPAFSADDRYELACWLVEDVENCESYLRVLRIWHRFFRRENVSVKRAAAVVGGASQAVSALSVRSNQISRRFGEVLRQQRLARGWSQSVLSTKSKVDRTYISQIEVGIHSPTITVLCRLSRALQVAPSVLITRLERRLAERPAKAKS